MSTTIMRVKDAVLEPVDKAIIESIQGQVDKDMNNSQKTLPFYLVTVAQCSSKSIEIALAIRELFYSSRQLFLKRPKVSSLLSCS